MASALSETCGASNEGAIDSVLFGVEVHGNDCRSTRVFTVSSSLIRGGGQGVCCTIHGSLKFAAM